MKIKPKVKKYGKGGSIKDDIININGDYYNNDIIDGLDRDARVLNNQENKFLNRYGVTDRNSFYNKFPTEEIFNFKNGSDKARHYGLSTPYVDETTITLKNGGSINKYPNGGKSLKYAWNKEDNTKIQPLKVPDYEPYSENINLDAYLKATQLFGDGVSFINPFVGRLISAPGDINDIVKNPKDIKNYITPFIPTVSKVGLPLRQAAKIDRFNMVLTGATTLSDLPEETWQTPKKQNGGNITKESDKPIKYGYGGSVSYKDFKKKYKDL